MVNKVKCLHKNNYWYNLIRTLFLCFLQIFSVFEGAPSSIEKSFTKRKYYLFGFYGKTREKMVAVIIRLIIKKIILWSFVTKINQIKSLNNYFWKKLQSQRKVFIIIYKSCKKLT